MFMVVYENNKFDMIECKNIIDCIVKSYRLHDSSLMDAKTFAGIVTKLTVTQAVDLFNSLVVENKIKDIYSGLQVEY